MILPSLFRILRSVFQYRSSYFFVVLGLFFSQLSWADCPPIPAVGNLDFGSTPIIVNPSAPIGEVIKKYTVTLSEVDSKCMTRAVGPNSRLAVGLVGYPVSPPVGGSMQKLIVAHQYKGLVYACVFLAIRKVVSR